MNKFIKKALALLLAIVMIVGFVPNLGIYADAATYTYNWGVRGEKATELSSAAVAFYNTNGVSYESLSAKSGAAELDAVPESDLYKALQTLMAENHTYINNYDAVKNFLPYTDCQKEDGIVYGFYSNIAMGSAWGEGSVQWSREHVWPNSKGLDGQDENDVMMLRPEDQSANSSRSNKAYGTTTTNKTFYPNEESPEGIDVRGDVARIALYQYVRWSTTEKMWGVDGVIESKEVLLDWMTADPVDTWEMGRNDAVQSITGTRNVFVDFPALAFDLFAEETPDDMDAPSYDEMEAQKVDVTFSANGAVISTAEEVCVGDKLTLPTATAPTGYTFVGWLATALKETETKPTVLEAGASYTVAGEVTLHAVFSKTTTTEVEGGGSGETTWKLVTNASQLVVGSKVVIAAKNANYAMSTTQNTNNRSQVAITKNSDNTIATPGDTVAQLTLGEGNKAGTYSFYCSTKNGYLYAASSSSNYLRTETKLSNNSSWDIQVASTGVATIKAQGTYTRNWMRYNSSSKLFACYSSGQADIALYIETKEASGSTTVTTTTYLTHTDCAHSATTKMDAVAATCTDAGNTAGELCSSCGAVMSGYVWQAPKGHNYVGVITAPTATENGYTTFTCSRCDDEYIADIVPALGTDSYTVTFSVPAGVAAVESQSGKNTDITLPEAGAPSDAYTFAGWVAATVTKTTEKPAFYAAGDAYTVSADVTLYALYTFTEGGSGQAGFNAVTSAAEVTSGKYILVVNGGYAPTYLDGSWILSEAADGTTATDTNVWTLTVDGTSVKLQDSKGTYVAPKTGNNNGILSGEYSWTLVDKGNGTFQFNGTGSDTTTLAANKSESYKFRAYKQSTVSGNATSYPSFFTLYKEGEAGTTYYATELCEHEYQAVVTAPDCTEAGYTTYTCSKCGSSYTDNEVAATGHQNTSTTTVDATCTEDGSVTVTCDDCGETVSTETLKATGHSFEEGVCSVCSAADPDYNPDEPDQPDVGGDNRYYIATIRTSGNYFYMTSDLGSASTKRYQAVDTGLTELPASISDAEAGYVFVLVANDDGTYSIYADIESDNKYLGWTSGNSGTLVAEADALKLTKDENDDGTVSFHFTASDAERYLALNGTTNNNYFAWYKSGQKQDLVLIPVAAGGDTPECAHANTRNDAAVPADCVNDGYEAGVFCLDCQKYISGHKKIDATGHDYAEVVTPPTATEAGYTTFTCNNCGDTYTGNETPALGQNYTVTFWAPDYAYAPEAQEGNKNGITLPSMTAPEGYSFLGWTTERVKEATAEAPVCYKAGTTFSVTEETTLYALYSYTEGEGTGETGFNAVTSAAEVTSGKYILVVNGGYAPTYLDGSWVLSEAADGTTATDTNVWTLTVDGASVKLQDSKGAYIAPKSGDTNGIQGGEYSWALEDKGDGTFQFKGTGSDTTILAANKGSDYKFRAYKSTTVNGNATSYPSFFTLYKETAAGAATYYTTEYAVAQNGDAVYSKVAEALAAATNSDTVKLTCDVYVSVDLDVYCTLDINGHVLNSTTVVDATTNDSQLMDSVGGGVIAADQVVMLPGNNQLPVEIDGKTYFEEVSVKQSITDTADGRKKLSFYIDKLKDTTKLDDAILAGEDVKVRITVAWTEDGVAKSHSFVYSDELVQKYTEKWDSRVFTCNISGLEELGEYTIVAEVVSCGVVVQAL